MGWGCGAVRSPADAPPRPDLTWLRHRKVERHHNEYVHPAKPAAAPVPAKHPAAPLDLSIAPAADPTPAAPTRPDTAAASRRRFRTLPYPRVQPGAVAVLQGRARTVTLTRVQSGVGRLEVSLLRAATAGDLALGMVCQRSTGETYVVQRLGDATAAPAGPLPLARLTGNQGGETIGVDLRQVVGLQRALLYGYSPSISALDWQGVVVATTHDGSRIEAPFDLPAFSGTVALLTLYNVHGELVVRAETEPFAGPPEMAAKAYGYDYPWLEGRLPARLMVK